MQWTDHAIILSCNKYGESSGIVSALTLRHGLFKGLARGINSKAHRGTYHVGNYVDVTWKGRLAEHLGNFTGELITPNAALLLNKSHQLAALSAVCALLDATLPEREIADDMFESLLKFIEKLKATDDWLVHFVLFEVNLLSHLGFRLDLNACAATGVEDELIYISPKSGRAVCRVAGEPYRDRLLQLPQFLRNGCTESIEYEEIMQAIGVCTYFLEKNIFSPHNKALPKIRSRFVASISGHKEIFV